MSQKGANKNKRIIPKKGEKYGRLTATGKWETRKTRQNWEFICDCGAKKWINAGNVRRRLTKSCGCLHKELTSEASLIDLTGKRFGRLLVLGEHKTKSKLLYWKCKCDCGNKKWIYGASLRHGRTKSCGCFLQERRGKTVQLKFKVGERFGKLTILGQKRSKKQRWFWECLCDCGGKTWVQGSMLKNSNTQSCGCLVKQQAAESARKRNKYPVILSEEERKAFEFGAKSRKTPKREKVRLKVLLLADRSKDGPSLDDVQIAKHLKLTQGKVFYVRHSFVNADFRKKSNDRHAKLWKEDIAYRNKKVVSHRIRISLKAQNSRKVHKALELLECSLDEFKEYLQSKFTGEMSWANFGQYGWHLDHIRPCASFDLTDEAQLKECFHYTNYQPLWASENIRKSSTWQGQWWGNRQGCPRVKAA